MDDTRYCLNPDCPFEDCKAHYKNAPSGVPVLCSYLDKTCRRYISWLLYEIERSGGNG